MVFAAGSQVVEREVWGDRVWLTHPMRVDSDGGPDGDPDGDPGGGGVLALVLDDGVPFTFDDLEPAHPWAAHDAWRGPTVLQLRRAGDWYAVWKFFGPAQDGHPFLFWYVNFERPVVRTDEGIDTDDLELDLLVHPDGRREWKDVEHLHARLAEGRFGVDDLVHVLEAAAEVTDLLDRDDRWWAPWDAWTPPAPSAPGRR